MAGNNLAADGQHRANLRKTARFVGAPFVIAALLFGPAGTLRWPLGWAVLFFLLAALYASAVYLRQVNPELIEARRHVGPGAKAWDRPLVLLLAACYVALLPLAAVDTVRFGWSHLPLWASGVGFLVAATGFWLSARAQAVNRFFEQTVRIQSDRGQRVIDSGPYRFVRHPGYLAGIIQVVGLALALGSPWALLPAGIASLVIVLRTAWEDATLRAELDGYEAYAARVPRRLLPGVW